MNNNQGHPYCTTNNNYPRELIPHPNWALNSPAVQGQPRHQHYQPQQQTVIVSLEQEKRVMDAWTTKLARANRKMASQIKAHLKSSSRASPSCTSTTITSDVIHHSNSNSSNSSSSGSATTSPQDNVSTKEEEEIILPNNAHSLRIQNDTPIRYNQDLYNFFTTSDNKRLRFVLKKELKNSDVGSLGRIVLPKREAEDKLPSLFDKEGIQLIIKDIYSNKEWCLRYKYWSNNKSRMYVLENTVNFVKQNGLEVGDSVSLYEDECKILYYVAMKKGNNVRPTIQIKSSCGLLNHTTENTTTEHTLINNMLHSYEIGSGDEEDMTNLGSLIQHIDQQETNLLASNLSHDYHNNLDFSTWANSEVQSLDFSGHYTSQMNVDTDGMSSFSNMIVKAVDENFDDCYGDLDALPEIDQYNHYGYESFFDRVSRD